MSLSVTGVYRPPPHIVGHFGFALNNIFFLFNSSLEYMRVLQLVALCINQIYIYT